MKQQTINNIIHTEIKKNIRNNILYLASFSSILVLLLLLSIFVLIWITQPLKLNLEAVNENYNYVVESKEHYLDFSCCYKLDYLVLITTNNGKRINSNVYVDIKDTPNTLLPKDNDLSSGGISVSKKIADQLKLSIGDTIMLDLPLYDEPIEYTVECISPYLWDCYDLLSNRDFSVSCLPYDDNLIEKVNGKYVYFLNDSERSNYQENDYSYNSVYNVAEDTSLIRKNLKITYLAFILFVSIISVILSQINSKLIYIETKKYRNSSYNISFIKKIMRINHVLYVFSPSIIAAILSSLLFCFGLVDILILITFWVLVLVMIVIEELKVKSFERVS